MNLKSHPNRVYHFKKLPFPLKLTIGEAENTVKRLNNLLSTFRRELYEFNERQGYAFLCYKNMPALVKSRLQEVSPRYIHALLEATKIEVNMRLNRPIGTIPYSALKLLKPYSVKMMKNLWRKSAAGWLVGESRVNALRRIIKSINDPEY
jgi:hypothetical protein